MSNKYPDYLKEIVGEIAKAEEKYLNKDAKESKKELLEEANNESYTAKNPQPKKNPVIKKVNDEVYVGDRLLKELDPKYLQQNIAMYFAKQDGILPKGFFVINFLETEEATREMRDGKIKMIVHPEKDKVWSNPNTDKRILAAIEGVYNQKDANLNVDSIVIRPDWQKKKIVYKLVNFLENHFNTIEINFSDPRLQSEFYIEEFAKSLIDQNPKIPAVRELTTTFYPTFSKSFLAKSMTEEEREIFWRNIELFCDKIVDPLLNAMGIKTKRPVVLKKRNADDTPHIVYQRSDLEYPTTKTVFHKNYTIQDSRLTSPNRKFTVQELAIQVTKNRYKKLALTSYYMSLLERFFEVNDISVQRFYGMFEELAENPNERGGSKDVHTWRELSRSMYRRAFSELIEKAVNALMINVSPLGVERWMYKNRQTVSQRFISAEKDAAQMDHRLKVQGKLVALKRKKLNDQAFSHKPKKKLSDEELDEDLIPGEDDVFQDINDPDVNKRIKDLENELANLKKAEPVKPKKKKKKK